MSAAARLSTSATPSTTMPINIGPASPCTWTTMMQVRWVYSCSGRPNFSRRSTTGITFPRRLMTPLTWAGVWGTAVPNSSRPSSKTRYFPPRSSLLSAAAVCLSKTVDPMSLLSRVPSLPPGAPLQAWHERGRAARERPAPSGADCHIGRIHETLDIGWGCQVRNFRPDRGVNGGRGAENAPGGTHRAGIDGWAGGGSGRRRRAVLANAFERREDRAGAEPARLRSAAGRSHGGPLHGPQEVARPSAQSRADRGKPGACGEAEGARYTGHAGGRTGARLPASADRAADG